MFPIRTSNTASRRAFLRGAGALVALPFLERFAGRNAGASGYPTRICFLYVPNGMYMNAWKPRETGPLDLEHLPQILQPLADPDLAGYLLVAGGLHNLACERHGTEGLGQHARSIAAYLSATYPDSAPQVGATIDVTLSRTLGARSRVPLLNLATEYAEDQRDIGYPEYFNHALSWKDATTPIQPLKHPRDVFRRLCGQSRVEKEGGSDQEQHSVLDAVQESGRSVRGQLGLEDRRTFDGYLEHLREVERELESPAFDTLPAFCQEGSTFDQEPASFEDRLRIMLDLLHLALRTDLTRVATMMFGAERSEQDFGFLTPRAGFDMSGGHHRISHHQKIEESIRRFVQISRFHTGHLARFLRRLRDTPEGDGNLLQRTLVVYGASMSDGNAHDHQDLPLLLAGKGGLINPGKRGAFVDFRGKPLANLYLTLLEALAVPDTTGTVYSSFGNSGGTLSLQGGY